jgi:hypothetical protein
VSRSTSTVQMWQAFDQVQKFVGEKRACASSPGD